MVRRAAAGERLVTLDGEDRELTPEMLVIADAERAVALAGVMGGRDSEVTAATRDVLLESAHFDRRRVRIGARALSMHTDASHRFERGADPGACRRAADRAAPCWPSWPAARCWPAPSTRRPTTSPRASPPAAASTTAAWSLRRRRHRARRHRARCAASASRWSSRRPGRERRAGWRVTAPTWRWYDVEPGPDGTIYAQDLYEEVLRLYGFDAHPRHPAGAAGLGRPAHRRAGAPRPHPRPPRRLRLRRGDQLRLPLARHGRLAPAPGRRGEHAGRAGQSALGALRVLRRSLVPTWSPTRLQPPPRRRAVRLFEVGHVFWHGSEGSGARWRSTSRWRWSPAAPSARRGIGASSSTCSISRVWWRRWARCWRRRSAPPAELPVVVAGAAAELMDGGEGGSAGSAASTRRMRATRSSPPSSHRGVRLPAPRRRRRGAGAGAVALPDGRGRPHPDACRGRLLATSPRPSSPPARPISPASGSRTATPARASPPAPSTPRSVSSTRTPSAPSPRTRSTSARASSPRPRPPLRLEGRPMTDQPDDLTWLDALEQRVHEATTRLQELTNENTRLSARISDLEAPLEADPTPPPPGPRNAKTSANASRSSPRTSKTSSTTRTDPGLHRAMEGAAPAERSAFPAAGWHAFPHPQPRRQQ